MKTILVEFTGAAREITGERQVRLELEDRTSYRGIVACLAERFPALVGTLISGDHQSMLSANLFSRDGAEPILPGQMDDIPANGECLVMLYFIVGGSFG